MWNAASMLQAKRLTAADEKGLAGARKIGDSRVTESEKLSDEIKSSIDEVSKRTELLWKHQQKENWSADVRCQADDPSQKKTRILEGSGRPISRLIAVRVLQQTTGTR
jgi:hypothetical protein